MISVALIAASRALLVRHAMASPNARSSHSRPTPQGGGIGVIGGTLIVFASASLWTPEICGDVGRLAMLLVAIVGMAIVGFIDDIRQLSALRRIILQIAAAGLVMSALPADLRITPILPWWLERSCILIGLVWFINLVNFMDGVDWMTVAEIIPITAGLGMFGLRGAMPRDATIAAVALFGAVIGFAPFNRPVARLFLGDVGSLPIGLILGWMLVLLAASGHLAAALLLPLYYLGDATVTLARRAIKGEALTQAHRSHFYQRATDHGYSVYQIAGIVFALNIVLVALAAASIWNAAAEFQVVTLLIGSALVGAVLWKFNSARY
jgi:UDP-N-acetylmuramyl pentapeptide phosphotransferase/UDP-N-acetylglucosamine-1-phosphate transferase